VNQIILLAEARRLEGSTTCPDPLCARMTGEKHKRGCRWAAAVKMAKERMER